MLYISLYFKWIYFIIKLNNNFKWMTTTKDGGEYLKQKLINLGIIGIKFGQYLHTQKQIINNEVKTILEPLLSHNKIHTKKETQRMIDYDDSNVVDTLIERIDEDVLGSGSLCQTHICYLKNNSKKYVLKIAHPDILNLENEVTIVKKIIKTISYFKDININWDNFFLNINEQSDLNNEANNMKIFYDMYKNYDKIEIPELIYSHKYFIIMSFCEGVTMNKLDKKSKEYISATNLTASCFLHSSYKNNINHADLHHGNILVKENGNIALLDFGICNKRVLSINENENNLVYLYKQFYYNLNIASSIPILKKIIKSKKENKKISYLIFTEKFLETYNLNSENKKDELYILECLTEYCFNNNMIIDSDIIHYIIQLILLESYAYSEMHNGIVLFRTFSYMKQDIFFMEEMKDYILKFYKLEYDNEPDERVRKQYP